MNSGAQAGDAASPRMVNGMGTQGPAETEGAGAAPAAATPREMPMSVIGSDILVTGNIEAEVDLHIEGRVQGDVRCSTLILGERSSVVGSIFAERVRVAGTIEGAVETTDLAIEATARVKGEVTYSRLRIANGGIIEGTMTHKPLDESAMLKLVEEPGAKAGAGTAGKVHYFE